MIEIKFSIKEYLSSFPLEDDAEIAKWKRINLTWLHVALRTMYSEELVNFFKQVPRGNRDKVFKSITVSSRAFNNLAASVRQIAWKKY